MAKLDPDSMNVGTIYSIYISTRNNICNILTLIINFSFLEVEVHFLDNEKGVDRVISTHLAVDIIDLRG